MTTIERHEHIRRLARDRGRRRCTFATADDIAVPGYAQAWAAGLAEAEAEEAAIMAMVEDEQLRKAGVL